MFATTVCLSAKALAANGGWMKNNAIPAKETRWDNFNILNDDNKKKIRGIVQEVSAKPASAPKGSLQ
ncbi:hypothetical protein ACFQ3S_12445 [Mucilaginibacter terrae]|uniref:hypothetical protein n=1 Tax=Mucilaginibacter terrae TaxID=1955052 RepID=UPI0036394303